MIIIKQVIHQLDVFAESEYLFIYIYVADLQGQRDSYTHVEQVQLS